MSESELVYASIALFLGVIKLLLDHRRNEILDDTMQAVRLVYEAIQDLDNNVQFCCEELAEAINSAVSGKGEKGDDLS